MLFFIGQVLPYLAMGIFAAGMLWRILKWLNTPVPFRLTLSPAPACQGRRALRIGRELLLFGALWRGGDRGLWLWAWLMHAGIAMIIMGHIVGISSIGLQFTPMGFTAAQSLTLSAFMGTVTGIVLLAAVVVLLYRRTAVPEVKRLSDPADYFDLLLLLAVIVSGMHMRMTSLEVDLIAIRAYLGGIITFHPVPIPKEWIFVSHFFLVNILLMYIPFSKLAHLAGSVVSQGLVTAPPPQYPTDKQSAEVRLWKGGNS